MSAGKATSLFETLWADFDAAKTFPAKRPLLAHYTSIEALEKIVSSNEIWLSNPLFMNDLEELRFGMMEGARAVRSSAALKRALRTAEKHEILLTEFNRLFDEFDQSHAFDTYIFCLSEHDAEESDGMLSMWRGYGGNGNGAAIVFDTSKLTATDDTPLILSDVHYATSVDRIKQIEDRVRLFAETLKGSDLSDANLKLAALAIFERLKGLAIFTKHRGFQEEREWRMVYLRDRDTKKLVDQMFSYAVGKNGIEPKLRLKVQPIKGLTTGDASLEKIVDRIILGPTISNPLSAFAVRRMLQSHGHHGLMERVFGSTTPFRSR